MLDSRVRQTARVPLLQSSGECQVKMVGNITSCTSTTNSLLQLEAAEASTVQCRMIPSSREYGRNGCRNSWEREAAARCSSHNVLQPVR